jgi:hypothetical protein
VLLFYSLWKERLNSEGQLFHQYQQSEQQPLTSTHWIQKKPTTYDIGKSRSWLGTGTKMWQDKGRLIKHSYLSNSHKMSDIWWNCIADNIHVQSGISHCKITQTILRHRNYNWINYYRSIGISAKTKVKSIGHLTLG